MSTERLVAAALSLATLGLMGCPGTFDIAAFEAAEIADTDAAPSCVDVPVAVFQQRCGLSGCHLATMPAANLDLVSAGVYARLSGRAAAGGPGVLIDPGGEPQKSVLYLKLTNSPPFGSQMPLTGTKLDAATLACVASWISTGGGAIGSVEGPDSGDDGDSLGPDDGALADSSVVDSSTPDSSGTNDVTTIPEATMPETSTKPEASTSNDGMAQNEDGGADASND
jgi:hypothetical protein